MSLLSTYSMVKTLDFILYIIEKDNDDQLWALWLAKDIEQDFTTFKNENSTRLRQKAGKKIDMEEVNNNIAAATRFIKPRKEIVDGK